MQPTYRIVLSPPNADQPQALKPQEIFGLLLALWDMMSHYDRDDRREYINVYLSTHLNFDTYSQLTQLTERILEHIEIIFENMNQLIEQLSGTALDYRAILEQTLGSAYVVQMVPVVPQEEI